MRKAPALATTAALVVEVEPKLKVYGTLVRVPVGAVLALPPQSLPVATAYPEEVE